MGAILYKILLWVPIVALVTQLLPEILGQADLTFSNPITDRNSADPCILKVGDNYYMSISENGERELWVYKSPILTNFRNAESSVALSCDGTKCSDVWASEMHLVDGELYMYFTMRVPEENNNHRMFVIKANNPSDPLGGWSDPIRIYPGEDYGGIDATVFNHGNGKRYYVYVNGAKLWIAPMISPTEIGLPRVLIREPDSTWECPNGGSCQDEGPFFIYNKDVSYLIFSAAGSFDPDYCLGQLSIRYDQDPMVSENWIWKPEPVFARNDEESVLGPGHAAFTLSPDETETWMVYHAHGNDSTPGRIARIDKITWNENDGSPIFPRPSGYNTIQPVPSGQTSV